MRVAPDQAGKAADSRFPAAKLFKAFGMGLRLVPSAVFQLSRGHRRFSRCFVEEAVQYGIPKAAAREMAGGLRPGQIFKALRKSEKDK